MKKSLYLARYLFDIQKKELNHMFFMFVIPLGLFAFNLINYGYSEKMILGFIAIAPIQMLLYQFGNTFMGHKQTGALVKYQLLGFKPLEVTFGIGISTLIFECLYVIFVLILSLFYTGSLFTAYDYFQIFGIVSFLNFVEFSLVLFLTSFSKSYQQYSSYSTVLFYGQLFFVIGFGISRTLIMVLGFIGLISFGFGLKKFKWHTAS